MSEGNRNTVVYFLVVGTLLLGVSIWRSYNPPPPPPPEEDPFERSIKGATPECQKLFRDQYAFLGRQSAIEERQDKVYVAKSNRIESADASNLRKDIAEKRLAEANEIETAKREADTSIGYAVIQQKLVDTGCLSKK